MQDPNQPKDPPSESDAAQPGETVTRETGRPKRCGRRYTHEQWEAVYQAWKVGERSKKALALRFDISEDTVHRYVESGLQLNGWPSFRSRLQFENETVVEAKTEAAKQIAAQVVDEYGKARQENLQVLRALRAACGQQVAQMIKNLGTITWTKKTLVTILVEGVEHKETIDRPLDAHEVATVARSLVGAIAQAGQMESFWLGGPTERIENIDSSEKFSKDELEYIEKNDGALPPGMTLEQFAAKMTASCGLARPLAGN